MRHIGRTIAACLLLGAPSAAWAQTGLLLKLQPVEPPKSDDIWKVEPGKASTGNYSGEARYDGSYTWDAPPAVIPPEGFTLKLTVNATTGTKQRFAAGIGISVENLKLLVNGVEQDGGRAGVKVNSEYGAKADADIEVKVVPRGPYGLGAQAEVIIGPAFGPSVKYLYIAGGIKPCPCPPEEICNPIVNGCVARVQPGEKLCPDGKAKCKEGQICQEVTSGRTMIAGKPSTYTTCIVPGSVRCDFNDELFCAPGTFCDENQDKCSDPVSVRPGEKRCPDGLSTCPEGKECQRVRSERSGSRPYAYTQCLVPGSTKCEFTDELWCPPGQFCDENMAKCSDPVPVRPGEKRCPDGLSTCPEDKDCQRVRSSRGGGGSRVYTQCLVPGSTKCEFTDELWCPPGQFCDEKNAKCSDPQVRVPGTSGAPQLPPGDVPKGWEQDTSRSGPDIEIIELDGDADATDCLAICSGYAGCRAFTFVNPGAAGNSAPLCKLKSGIGPATKDPCCVSGTVTR